MQKRKIANPIPCFLDTNILLRYFVPSDPDKALRAKALLKRVERGEEKVVTSTMVVFEVVFTLQRTYKVHKAKISEMVGNLISLRSVQLTNKRLYLQALTLYAAKNLSFADAYNAVYLKSRGLSEIYSWDTDFDKVEGLVRVEPNDTP